MVINAVAVVQERYGPTAKAYPMDVIDILRRKLPAKPYLHEFLAESSVCPPEGPAPKKKNPEYEAHMDAVRAKLEDREYDRCELQIDLIQIKCVMQYMSKDVNTNQM